MYQGFGLNLWKGARRLFLGCFWHLLRQIDTIAKMWLLLKTNPPLWYNLFPLIPYPVFLNFIFQFMMSNFWRFFLIDKSLFIPEFLLSKFNCSSFWTHTLDVSTFEISCSDMLRDSPKKQRERQLEYTKSTIQSHSMPFKTKVM